MVATILIGLEALQKWCEAEFEPQLPGSFGININGADPCILVFSLAGQCAAAAAAGPAGASILVMLCTAHWQCSYDLCHVSHILCTFCLWLCLHLMPGEVTYIVNTALWDLTAFSAVALTWADSMPNDPLYIDVL